MNYMKVLLGLSLLGTVATGNEIEPTWGPKRETLKEWQEAAAKHGLKLGFCPF